MQAVAQACLLLSTSLCIAHLNQHHHIVWPKLYQHIQFTSRHFHLTLTLVLVSLLGACWEHVSSAKRIVNKFICTSPWRALKVKQYSVTTCVLTVKVQLNGRAATHHLLNHYFPDTSLMWIKQKIWSHKSPALLKTSGICWLVLHPNCRNFPGITGKQIDGNASSKVYMFFPWWKGSLQGWFRHKLQEMRNVLANAQGSVHIHCMFLSTAAYSYLLFHNRFFYF